MGVTSESIKIINRAISGREIKIVCDIGAQNDYRDEIIRSAPRKFPYFSDWWILKGIQYMSIDLNGENGSEKWDLSKPLPTQLKFDLVCDFGTSEHVNNIYQCFVNIDSLCKIGGLMIHENPKTENWPAHCFHYYTQGFYIDLAAKTGYEILDIGETIAMGNDIDGKNIYCVLQKTKEGFINKEQFPKTMKQ